MRFPQFRQRTINMRGSGVPQHQLCLLFSHSIQPYTQVSPCGALAIQRYRKWQNSDPRSSETLQDNEMRFGVLDYVVEDSPPKNYGVAPQRGRPPRGVKYNGFWKFLIHFFSASLQVRRKIVHMWIMAQNAWSGPRKCLWGVLTTLNHFWVNGVPKTPKIFPEIGIFHVVM